jgi:hypothetical protein
MLTVFAGRQLKKDKAFYACQQRELYLEGQPLANASFHQSRI